MEIITLISNKSLCNTYIIKNNNKCVIIDCGVTLSAVKNAVGNCEVKAILLTHAHFDHIYYLKEYLNEFKCFVYGSKNCIEKFNDEYKNESCVVTSFNVKVNIDENQFKPLVDNDVLNFIDENIFVISLSGHSSCCMGYIIKNNIFCGDTLFKNAVGRYDLWDSNEAEHIESINKILNLKPINVYCGHGENFSI